MNRLSLFLVIVISLSVRVSAQEILSYQIAYYWTGASNPFQFFDIQSGNYLCGQYPIVNTDATNPTTIEWDDPLNPGYKCQYTESVGGILLSLPTGNYEATLRAVNSFGTSAESNRAPFVVISMPGPTIPTIPTGLKFVRAND